MEKNNLTQRLGQAMMNLSNEQILLHEAVANTLGLNITDHKCVNLIARFSPMTAGKLAELTGLTTGAITGVIDRLEKGGYAKRVSSAEDRRVTTIVLTKKGESISKVFLPLVKSMREVSETFSDKELETILKYVTAATNASHEVSAKMRKENAKK